MDGRKGVVRMMIAKIPTRTSINSLEPIGVMTAVAL